MFVAFVLVLLPQADDLLDDLDVVTFALGLLKDFLLALVQGLDLFLDVFDELDDSANALALNSPDATACSNLRRTSLAENVSRRQSRPKVHFKFRLEARQRPACAAYRSRNVRRNWSSNGFSR
jgi:hypothetical protein